MDDFPERRGPMSKMCGLLTFGWQVELENEAMLKFLLTVRGQFECVLDQPNETTRPLFVDFYYFLIKKGKCFKLYV